MSNLTLFSFPQLERRGALVVEFEAPLVTGLKLPVQQRRVVFPEDVIQFSPSVPHSLQPGDKVLAPWEPEQQQYGPGTVLLGLKKQKGQKGKEAVVPLHPQRSTAGGHGSAVLKSQQRTLAPYPVALPCRGSRSGPIFWGMLYLVSRRTEGGGLCLQC